MDETKNPSVNEMLDAQPRVRTDYKPVSFKELDQQTAGFRAAAAAADEMNLRTGFRTQRVVGEVHDMRTEDDKQNEAKAEECLKEFKNPKPKRAEHRREAPYPELSKGKLLFQTEEYDAPKEYITLQMNESKEVVKKILDHRGCLTGHPEIPVDALEWNMPNLDQITSAVMQEFPDEKMMTEKSKDITGKISKLLGGVPVSFNRSNHKLMVGSVQTKFDIREINAAVTALAILIPLKEAERIVSKEIAKKIQNVL